MRAILAVLVLLAAAPAAQARSFSIAAPDIIPSDLIRTSTIGVAGEQVVWLEQRGAAAALVAATADGTRRDLLTLPSTPSVIVGTNDLRVIDWRTGKRIRRVRGVYFDPLSHNVALGEDGTLAWAGERAVEVLRPGAQRTRRAGPIGAFITQPRIAGGSLVVRRIAEDGADQLRVSALDGSGARSVAGQAPRSFDPRRDEFGWAFDGSRVVWVARPCVLPTIQVWDLAEAPPARVSEACGRSSLPGGTLRFGARRTTVPVAVSCPATPADGCAGELSARFRARGREVGAAYLTAFAVPAGTTRTVALRVASPRALRGQRGVTATVDLTEGTFNATRRFRVQG